MSKGPWPRRRHPLSMVVLVLALHLLLLGALLHGGGRGAPPVETPVLAWLRLVAAPTPPAPVAEPVVAAATPRTRAPSRRPTPAPTPPAAAAPNPAPATEAITTAPAPAEPASAAVAAASANLAGRPGLLDSEATRRALREAALRPSRAEEAAESSNEPAALRPEQRLGREVARSALGDCLKGEFAGGGMGLLSLPFLVAAELRGKCRR